VLGIVFSPDQQRNYAVNWEDVIFKAEKTSQMLAKRSLSRRGRALVCNTLVLSKAWHVARVYTPSKHQCADSLQCALNISGRTIMKKSPEIFSKCQLQKAALISYQS